jgi:hypothetical protein
MDPHVHALRRLHKLGVIAAIVVFSATAALALGLGRAGAAKTTVLGAAAPAKPQCPQDPCEAVGKVTGFQLSIGRQRKPFLAPFDGKIVAWSIKLSRPDQKEQDCFSKGCGKFPGLGGAPTARIAVLKPIRKQIRAGKPIYRLRAQSPLEQLQPFLGTTTTFALRTPLNVREGNIVALSVRTWASAFSITGQAGITRWRASRKKGRCLGQANLTTVSRPHENVGSERNYGCVYKGARLLYSATLAKRPARR